MIEEARYITSSELAELAGVNKRIIQRALKRGHWRKCELDVIQSVNDKGQQRLDVNINSLPIDLQEKCFSALVPVPVSASTPVVQKKATAAAVASVAVAVKEQEQTVIEAMPQAVALPALGEVKLTILEREEIERAQFRNKIVQDITEFPTGSKMYTQAVLLLSEKHGVSKASVYRWIELYKNGGFDALVRKPNKSKGTARALISRKWDKAFIDTLGLEKAQDVEKEIKKYVRSLWAEGVTGYVKCSAIASAKLAQITAVEAGLNVEAVQALCKLTRHYVERDKEEYSLLAIDSKDAKKFYDKHLPRIQRKRDMYKPMDIIVGDVHPLDIAMHRDDGSVVYPKLVAWQDIATNRLYITMVVLKKGEGVTRKHIAASFASMCESWGLPRRLYLDNGSEYKWSEMINAFNSLAKLAESSDLGFEYSLDGDHVHRARPYNSAAKPIEGLFSVLQGFNGMLDGYHGGDRMNKKIHHLGKAAPTFQGDEQAMQDALDTQLRFYHNMEQKGTLDGMSPNAKLQQFIDEGWKATGIQYEHLLLAFSVEDERVIDRGYVNYNGQKFYSDALLAYTGRKLRIRYPSHDPKMVFVFEGDALLCVAKEDEKHAFLSSSGAAEQARRNKKLQRVIKDRKKNIDRLSLLDEVKAMNLPDDVETPKGLRIDFAGDTEKMAKAIEEGAKIIDDSIGKNKKQQVSQWLPEDGQGLPDFEWGEEDDD